ncbi:MAG TPA: prepilin-type N-terminal cleavage/methylation domain-containing protein [Candidatus Paceibacterota bacterium]|nr:prepilin-type N-terminal cleavage/methylation domain-containing protein [Candidatus Paceibacterota bacterium]
MSFNFKKFKKAKFRKGMTYVELIVVLSIFSIMSAISLFDYRKFEAKVEIKNLANDIALQIVDAQKSAMAGKLSTLGSFDDKPAYGVYFSLSDNQQFIPFADFNDNKSYESGEGLDVIKITKQSFIKDININGGSCSGQTNDVNVVFERPDSTAFVSTSSNGSCSGFSFVDIYVSSADHSAVSHIDIYPTGRIEIK